MTRKFAKPSDYARGPKSPAYVAGRDAARAGQPKDTNPYPRNSKARAQWNLGYVGAVDSKQSFEAWATASERTAKAFGPTEHEDYYLGEILRRRDESIVKIVTLQDIDQVTRSGGKKP